MFVCINIRSRLLYKGLALLCIFFPSFSNAQSIHLNGDQESFHHFDRINVLQGYSNNIHTSNRNINRQAILSVYNKIEKDSISHIDQSRSNHFITNNRIFSLEVKEEILENKQEFIDSSNTFYKIEKTQGKELHKATSKPILKYFYKTKANFLEINEAHFRMTINPILNIKVGKEKDNELLVFQNLRGIELIGLIDNKVYFYTNILENQQRFNNYTEDWINDFKAIPGAGLYKNYNSTVIDQIQGWDFLNAMAYVGLNISKSIGIEIGHGSHFIGNGIRSLLLSDYSNNYFYLKFNTKIWKFQYQNIFAELSALSSRNVGGDQLLPKKYFAAHYLSYKPWQNLEIGLFETVVFSRENHFEFQYLNPIILYRTVEHLIGSPDNALLGINANLNLFNHISIYGQFVLDEFKLSELKNNSGWWANKYGTQIGIKYFDVLNIDQLDAQIEYNSVRPYTYSHSKTIDNYELSIANYSNYNQPLAHPRGANFNELLISLRYRPLEKLLINTKYMHTVYGEDLANENWGTNILKLNTTREMDFDNQIGQGNQTDIDLFSFDISYEVFQNYYVDIHYLYRNQNSTISDKSFKTNYLGGGIRINIGQFKYDY